MSGATTYPERKRRNGLAAFRALEPEVRAALTAGRTLVDIYAEKRARLAMSYSQFARYAQPFRKDCRAALRPAPTPIGVPRTQPQAIARAPPTSGGEGPPRGRPEEAVPTLNMDRFATRALNDEDLF